MAKITIAGDSIVITSSKTLEAIKDLEKYRPKALRLYERDEDGSKTEVFRVASGSTGVINGNGAVFRFRHSRRPEAGFHHHAYPCRHRQCG